MLSGWEKRGKRGIIGGGGVVVAELSKLGTYGVYMGRNYIVSIWGRDERGGSGGGKRKEGKGDVLILGSVYIIPYHIPRLPSSISVYLALSHTFIQTHGHTLSYSSSHLPRTHTLFLTHTNPSLSVTHTLSPPLLSLFITHNPLFSTSSSLFHEKVFPSSFYNVQIRN